MTPRLTFLTATLVTALAACGGGAGSGPISSDDFRDGCKSDCERRVRCGTTTDTVEVCTEMCFADYAQVSGWLRGDAAEDIFACGADLACGADDDVCLMECTPTGAHQRYEAQCREVFAPCVTEPAQLEGICEVSPMPGVDGDVGFFCLLIPDIMDELTACIPDGTACEAGAACIQAALERRGVDF